jgi:hypothetical protein
MSRFGSRPVDLWTTLHVAHNPTGTTTTEASIDALRRPVNLMRQGAAAYGNRRCCSLFSRGRLRPKHPSWRTNEPNSWRHRTCGKCRVGSSLWSQTSPTPGQPIQQNPPGAGGVSKPGLPGLPGSKSGPSVTSSGTTRPENRTQPSGHQSGVQGLLGNKSGPAVKPSQSGR